MDYEFVKDPVHGGLTARFSLEHEAFGRWLETEMSANSLLMTQLLQALAQVTAQQQQEVVLTGREYSIFISLDEVRVEANGHFVQDGELPEEEAENFDNVDPLSQASCGFEDFVYMIKSWAKF